MLRELTCHTWAALMFWIVSLIFSPMRSSSLSTNSACSYLHAHIPVSSDLALSKMTNNKDTKIVLVQSPLWHLLSHHLYYLHPLADRNLCVCETLSTEWCLPTTNWPSCLVFQSRKSKDLWAGVGNISQTES